MDVLVVESHLGAAERLRRTLEDRGHRVLTCHEDEHERNGCHAVHADQGCPLDRGRVDVAVDVRRSHHPDPRPLEQGAICAVRARVPLVVAGAPSDSPLEAWATAHVLGDVPAIVDAVESVDGAISPMHQQVVDEALDVLLPGEGATAVVHRRDGQIQVELALPSHLSPREAEMVAVRLVAAIRRFDTATTTIDVALATRAGAPS